MTNLNIFDSHMNNYNDIKSQKKRLDHYHGLYKSNNDN